MTGCPPLEVSVPKSPGSVMARRVRVVKVEIECGEDTCLARPGSPCAWMKRDGCQYWRCGLFQKPLYQEDGFIRRCQQCKNEAK